MNIPKTYLTEAIDSQSVLKILINKNKQIDNTHPKYNYYKELADWANPRQQEKIKNVDLSTIKLSDRSLIGKKLVSRYNSLGSLLDALKNLMDQEGRYNPDGELAQRIQRTMLEILAELSNKNEPQPEVREKEPEETDEQSSNNRKLYQGMDWTAEKAQRLKSSEGAPSTILDKFYDDYYSVEYAGVESPEKDTKGIVAKLKSLDKILIPEFNALGYNPEVNPLAQFLKLLIEYKPDIFNRLTINTYGAVHNSFINKYITGNMLGKKFDETNILFCSDLYANNGLDIIEYLSLQDQVLKAKKNSEYVEDAYLIAKIFIQQSIQPEQAEQKSNYSAQVEKLLDMQKPKQPGDDNAKLRSLLEIRELYRHIFKVEAEKTKKKVNLKTVNDIVDEAEKQDVVLDMIKLILAQNDYAGSTKYAEEAQMFDGWLDKRNHTYTKKSIETSRKILLDYTLNAETLSLIIQNLVHRINKPTENKK